MNRGILTSLFLLLALLPGCTGIPDGIRAVENIDTERYLGKWYEIARLDHSFERGMNRVTAQYSLRDDGGIRVINRGYKEKKKEGRVTREPGPMKHGTTVIALVEDPDRYKIELIER